MSDPLSCRPEAAERIFRGGSWLDDAGYCRVACRHWSKPSLRSGNLGLRLARSVAR